MKKINQGGLYRCCIQFLQDYIEKGGPDEPGRIIQCPVCRGQMIAGKEEWVWVNDREKE